MKLSSFSFGIIVLAASCISQSKTEYVRGPHEDELKFSIESPELNRIYPGDELYIRVSSFDDVAFNFFGTQTENRQNSFANDISVSMISYAVNDSGYIFFPTLGHVLVKGLTIDEMTDKMEKLLSEYFNQPAIIIKMVNKNVSVIGEVRTPGHYTYTKGHLNIFEALSLAGDATLNGNKNEVVLIREVNQEVKKVTLDLTNDKILSSPYFFVESNDVIYVKSRHSAHWNITASTYSLILTSVTTFILILNYVH